MPLLFVPRTPRTRTDRPRGARGGPRSSARPSPGSAGALRATNREPTLVELRLPDLRDPHWTRELVSRWGARVRLRACRTVGRRNRRLLQVAEVALQPEAVPAVERFLRHRPELRQLSIVRADPSRILVRTVEPAPPLCALLIGGGAFCATCRFLAGSEAGGRPWTVVVPRGTAGGPIVRAAKSLTEPGRGQAVPVRLFRPARGTTNRQSRALEVAHRLGYYRFPRRGRLADVARALGVSRSTASELLRRAEAKVVSDALVG